jgi:hypothetical protein
VTDLVVDATAHLPLRVRDVEVQDPVILLAGESWSLLVACPWEITGDGINVSWLSHDVEDAAWDMVGRDLLAVTGGLVDPVFHFSSATTLTVHADSDLDPWVLSLPGIVYVGRTGE